MSPLGACPRVLQLGQMVVLLLIVWEISVLVSMVTAPVYTPTSTGCCLFFPPTPRFLVHFSLVTDGPTGVSGISKATDVKHV